MAWYPDLNIGRRTRRIRRQFERALLGRRRPQPMPLDQPISLDLSPELWTETSGGKIISDPADIAVVTGFFDIGRGDWKPWLYGRSTELYFERFARLAKLKNPMVIYCEAQHADRIMDIRVSHGLGHLTRTVSVPSFFGLVGPARLASEHKMRMTRQYARWHDLGDTPEVTMPKYNAVITYKVAFVVDAIRRDFFGSDHVAWIDFGYCRDEERFDPLRPWRFQFDNRMTLFHVAPLEMVDVAKLVRSGNAVVQACHMVGTPAAWKEFLTEQERCATELLSSGLADDEQTLFYMAWMQAPERYATHYIDPQDWFVLLRDFSE